MMQRRHFMGAGMAVATGLTVGAAWTQGAPNLGVAVPPASGVRRVKVGAAEVIALNDGVIRRPLGEEFVRNAPLQQVQSLLAAQNLPTAYIDVPYTAFLVLINGQKVLMDTGFADNGGPTTGRLVTNLAQVGLTPADIDVVLISHCHGDHINGLRNKAGTPVFPNARVMVPAPEYDYWMDGARLAAAPPAAQGGFRAVRRAFEGLDPARVFLFTPGERVLPGIESIAAFGHSPGHTLFAVRSQGKSFAYIADASHYPALFVRSPDWQVQFDMNPEMARQSRRRTLEMAASERMLVGGYHFPFPAMGHIEQAAGRFQYLPTA
jgi:glyoxylase-like metal-dependent hydrolase (beta-lactamase superfamily II)